MKTKPAYLKHMLGLAGLLLLAPAGILAQEGYYGATETISLGAERPIPVLAARSDTYSGGGGEGYYGAQQPRDTCAQSPQVTVRKTGHIMLVRGTKNGDATPRFADQDTEIFSSCVPPRSSSVRAVPDPSASQNRVEYGGGGM